MKRLIYALVIIMGILPAIPTPSFAQVRTRLRDRRGYYNQLERYGRVEYRGVLYYPIGKDSLQAKGDNSKRDSIIIPAILTIDNKPYTVAQLMPSSFENNKLRYASIPPTVTEIPSSCFYRCFYLEECLIPGAKIIDAYAFFRSTISKIEFPDSLEEIRSYAFYECNHLRSITLPANLKRIGDSAFRDCRGLDTVIVNFHQPIPIHEESFWGTREGAYKKPIVLVVPAGSKSAFESDLRWKRFATIIEKN